MTSSTPTPTHSNLSTPSVKPTGKWRDAVARAKAVVSGMSVEDKVALGSSTNI